MIDANVRSVAGTDSDIADPLGVEQTGRVLLSRKIQIDLPHEVMADFCRQHHIRRLLLFGSVLRDDFGPSSDVDVLVEFNEGKTPGLGFFTIQSKLSKLLGRPVDLNTPKGLSPYFAKEIMAEAELVYVAA